MTRFHQGTFKPKYPKKYYGNPGNIIYRSGLELRFMMFLDHNPDIIKWASEELTVAYRSPLDNQIHKYYPDFLIKTKADKTYMIEIKPLVQTKPPVLTEGKTQRKFRKESITFAVNQAKWHHASEFCKKKGWEFKIITDKDINGFVK